MKIKVTQDNIDNGRRSSAGFCPIALACKDTGHPDFSLPLVNSAGINLYKPDFRDKIGIVKLPPEALDFIDKFDNLGTPDRVQPFEFEVDYNDI